MHPFWLTFETSELEKRFQYEQREARLPTDKICALSLLAYELVVQYRYAFFHGVWPVSFLTRLVLSTVPWSVISWCYLKINRKDLLALQPVLAVSVKLYYAPCIAFFLELISFPDRTALEYFEMYSPQPCWLIGGMTLALGVTGILIPFAFSTMGIRVGFKRQFYILLFGVPLRFWWTRKELGHLSSVHPAGVQYMNDLSASIDTYADVVLHFSHSSTQHQSPSPFTCDQVVAFLNFIIGILCLTWLWWCELLDRERFLKRLVFYRPHDNHVKAVVCKESRVFRYGLDLDGWMEHPCFLLTGFAYVSCLGAITWKSISFFFEVFATYT